MNDEKLIKFLRTHRMGTPVSVEAVYLYAADRIEALHEALRETLAALGNCNDLEKARGRCAGHAMLTRLPCFVAEARKVLDGGEK